MNSRIDATLEMVPTRAMLLRQQSAAGASDNTFKVTVFESHKSKKSAAHNLNKTGGSSNSTSASSAPEFDLKRAKHEVLHFGISGFDATNKTAAKQALAIRLGAKPAPNAYKNYKELQAERQQARQESAENAHRLQLGKNAQGVASVTYKKIHNARKRKQLSGPITTHYGVVNPKMAKKKKSK